MIAPATKANVTSATPPARIPRCVVRSPQMKTANPRLARRTSAAMPNAHTASSTTQRGRGECGPAPRAAARRRPPCAPRIGGPRLEAPHVEPEANRRERDTEQEALELAVRHGGRDSRARGGACQ